MKLPFESLIAFHSVVINGSFSAAARKLGKSQSTISGGVKFLENELGYGLIERNTSPLCLTDRGKKIFQLSSPIVAKYQELQTVAASLSNNEQVKIRIGIDPFVFNDHVKQVLIEFSEIFPDTELTVITKPSHVLARFINDQRIDMAIANPYHKTELNFNIDELFMVNCQWIGHVDFNREQAANHVRLLLIDGYEDIVDLNGIAQHNIWKLDDASTVIDLCLARKGIAFLPHHLIENHHQKQLLAPINNFTELFGKQVYASLIWPAHCQYGQYHQWIHQRLRH
ncbi:LysR family transcriptional regulator [Vibrio hippocampi]|uniref:HTH-type transcriptional regulator YahB n=1 Tax=Vibrio hippocampi TaxID=654686 RepID=A0ABM8ZMF6_9VIBR|nr:LysR family transcriptional regulator [Vibrio hippocampi]CAH0529487.1 putative HTH-type transcriptional regulator YahB [Vibrio hippocampi]